jgi:hypothetical protein
MPPGRLLYPLIQAIPRTVDTSDDVARVLHWSEVG